LIFHSHVIVLLKRRLVSEKITVSPDNRKRRLSFYFNEQWKLLGVISLSVMSWEAVAALFLNRKRKYNSWIDISQPCYSLLYSFYQNEKCCSIQYIKCMMRKSIGIIVPHVESTHDVTKVINDGEPYNKCISITTIPYSPDDLLKLVQAPISFRENNSLTWQ
jgi:hypothetical protein